MAAAEIKKTYNVPEPDWRAWLRYLGSWNCAVEPTLTRGLELLEENPDRIGDYTIEFDGPSKGVATQVRSEAKYERKPINTKFSIDFRKRVKGLSTETGLAEGTIVDLAIQCLLIEESSESAPPDFLENGVSAETPKLVFSPHSEKISDLKESREVFVDRTLLFAALFKPAAGMQSVNLTSKALLERGQASKVTLYSTAAEVTAVMGYLTLQTDLLGFGKFVRVLRIVPVSAQNFHLVHPGLPRAREAQRPISAKLAVEATRARSLELIFATVSDDFDGLVSPKLIAKP